TAIHGSRIEDRERFLMSLASQHLKRLYERFRERTVRHRVEIVAVLTIVATLEDWPATDPRSDILSPCAGNSILASQALTDGATGLFDKVTIDRTGDKVVVHLTEAKLLDRVAFEGNKKIKDTELAGVVQSKARGSLQRATVQADVGRIMEAYRHVGRDDVGVV